LADVLARVVAGPSELPVGLITAAIGAPTFILLLVRARHRAGGVS
jgi:iron complex transport system permease protein